MREKNNKTIGYTENANYRCMEDHQQLNTMSIISPLNLDYCGIEQCESGHIFGPYVRENYVVHIILNGRGILKIGEQSYKLLKESAFVIYPGEEVVYQADCSEPWEYMWIGFHGYMAKKIVNSMGFTEKYPLIHVKNVKLMREEVEKMLDARQPTLANMLKRSSALYALVSMLIDEEQDCKTAENSSNMAYVNKAIEIMVQSYSEKLKISDMATTIGISRNYLTDLFKQELGISPQNFLMNFRMEKAAQELKETDESVQNIGINVGYPDPLAFSKAFKQKYGMSPSSYRTSSVELVQCNDKGEYVRRYEL